MSLEMAEWLLKLITVLILPFLVWIWRMYFSLRKENEDLRARIAAVEQRQEFAPTATALHELSTSVTGLVGEVKALGAQFDGTVRLVERLTQVVDRQEDYLLKRGGGSQ